MLTVPFAKFLRKETVKSSEEWPMCRIVTKWRSSSASFDESLGPLDILINNAGIGIFKPTADLTLEDWHRVIDTNLTGAFYCSHEALPRLRQRGGGYIINMSSLAGKNPFAGAAAYNASKFGLNGFSEAMMLDHRYDDIRVSYIMPGSVDTQFGSHADRREWKIAPEDISAVVLMLPEMPAANPGQPG